MESCLCGSLAWAGFLFAYMDKVKGGGGGTRKREMEGWDWGCVLDGVFTKQSGKGIGTGRVGMQRRPWRSIPKIAVHGNFSLGSGQTVK